MDLIFDGNLCLNKEDMFFEAKSAIKGIPMSTWESYSAFANSFGGVIILGLDEKDGALVVGGVKDTKKIVNEIWNTVNNPQKINCNILRADDVNVTEHNGKEIITINVPRADRHDCPVYINNDLYGGTFRRNGPNDHRCNRPEIASMVRESADMPLDASVLDDFDMNDIDLDTLSRYRTFMRLGDEKHLWNTVRDDEFLRLIGAVKKDKNGELRPTMAGLLMFGHEYRISCELPDYKLDYMEYIRSGAEWEHRIISGDGRWSGNVFDFYMNVANRLSVSVNRPFSIGGDWRRIDDTDIDKALRESLINALVHTDYRGRAGIRMEVRPDVVIVRNPGLFRIPIRTAKEGGYSDPRNPTLAKMFSLIGAAERAGSGLYRIMETWKNNGLESPLIEEDLEPPSVQIILSMKADPRTSVISEENRIINIMATDGNVSIEKISQMTGITKSRVEMNIKKLREAGRVKRIGEKRGGRWMVV
ncbi:MAG: putative DNA binding domain-containing protein [Methanomassiliicoccaceae archaeon]|nr:putative DNA binding domain-containing protein [Methanomassiliicoccaceae archaeon]